MAVLSTVRFSLLSEGEQEVRQAGVQLGLGQLRQLHLHHLSKYCHVKTAKYFNILTIKYCIRKILLYFDFKIL